MAGFTAMVAPAALAAGTIEATQVASESGVVCSGGTFGDKIDIYNTTPYRYASVYLPAGSTVVARIGGTSESSAFGVRAKVFAPDGATAIGGSPYAKQIGTSGGAIVSTEIIRWQTPVGWTGQTVLLGVQFTTNGGVVDWYADVEVTGGSEVHPDCTPHDPLETAVPSPAHENGCGTHAGDPVNVVEGNFWQTWSDLLIPGRGASLSAGRTYSSLAPIVDGPLGFGWSFSYGMSLVEASGTVRIRQENGSLVPFSELAGSWVAPARVNATLVEDSGSVTARWIFTRKGREVFRFNSTGQLKSISDLSGNTTILEYSGTELSTVTEPSNRQLVFTWTGGKITKVTAPATTLRTGGSSQAMEVLYAYASGDLTTVTETNAGIWTYTYDTSHRLKTIREPRHHALGAAAPVLENSYNATTGKIDWQEDRLDRRTTFSYTATQTTVTDPKNQVVVYEHSNGVCTGIIRDPGPSQSRWTFVVDPVTLGRTKVTDPNGNVTTAAFNTRGQPSKITTPKGTTEIAYDPITRVPTSIEDTSGVTTTLTYAAGTDRLTGISRPVTPGTAGPWTVGIAYLDPANPGRATSVTDPRGKPWSLGYSAQGDLTSVADPTGKVTSWTYNSHGWPLSQVAPAGNAAGGTPSQHTTSYDYNRDGEVVKITDSLGAATEYGRDLSGFVEWVKDPVVSGIEQSLLAWNAAGELTTVTRPDLSTLVTEYWPDGSLKTQRDGANNPTGYAYDAQGRLLTITDPANRVTTFRYDAGGRVVSKQQPGGDCLAVPKTTCATYGYNTAGELTAVDYSDPATSDVSFGYNALGQRTSMTDQDGTSTWAYDSIGRLLSFVDPMAGMVSYGYLDNGPSATSVNYPGGKVLALGFDDAGRQISSSGWTGGPVGFGYDDNSNPTTTDTGATTGVEDTFGYDRANRMTAFALRQGTTALASLNYTRDPEGMLTGTTGTGITGAADSFTYSPLDQIGSDSVGGYEFDAADNLTGFPDGRRQKFNSANELCYVAATNTAPCGAPPAGATTFGYDNGNRTTMASPQGTTSFGYDQADRLTSVTDLDPSGTEGQFHPVTPTRVLDTRVPIGTCSTAPCSRWTAGADRTVQVAGVGGVPADAEAVVVNVTAVLPTTGGFATLYPAGTSIPDTSNVNFDANSVIANAAIARLGTDGKVRVYSSAATDLIIDVTGWYSPAGATPGSEFHAVSPQRALDTRSNLGQCPTAGTCTSPGANQVLTVKVAGVAGVPATGVESVVLNLTATGATSSGYLTAYPSGAVPNTSNISFPAGGSVAGLVTSKLDVDGTIKIWVSSPVQLIADVAGYYTVGAGTGSTYQPAGSPFRLLDTRNGVGSCDGTCQRIPAGGTLTVDLAGQSSIPADASAVAVNVTASSPSAGGFLTIYPSGLSLPDASNLNYNTGQSIANAAIVRPGADRKLKIYASAQTDVLIDVHGWFTASSETWRYTYSGDGLRRTKTAPEGTLTTFTWDRSGDLPLLLAEVIDAPGTANDKTVRYLHDPTGAVLADIAAPASGGTETLRWYHHDQLGSTRALTDNTGAIIATYTYSPFGELTASTGTATTPFGWVGEYRDSETGFVYLRARHYDPATAQFLTRDPLESVTREAYSYGANDPINNVDPSGLDACGRPEGALGLFGSLVDCVANPTDLLDQNLETAQQVNEHLTIQPQVCVGYCVGFTYNHGRVYFSRGWGGFMLPGVSGGWTTTPYDEVDDPCFDGVESYYGPGFGISGNEEYTEYQVGYGLGIALLFGNRTSELFTLPGFG
ncbi:MAG: RHS repeat-associated core domain-containing protein [Acidimicrobiales bacterium]